MSDKVQKLRDEGLTYQAIADQLGVTRQRVHQILKLDNSAEHKLKRNAYRREYYHKNKEK